MALGLAAATANAIMNGLCRNTAWTQPAAVWVKLHIGDPGSAATANAASNTTRVQATFGTAASGGAVSNTAAIDWTSVPTAEDYTHFSAWDASTAGNFLFSGTITANAVAVGDNFSIPIGDCDVSVSTAA
jgi:hypothetical protein